MWSESVSRSFLSNSLQTPWTVACQAPLSMEFSRQEYWSGLPGPVPGDLPDPGFEPKSLALQEDFFFFFSFWGFFFNHLSHQETQMDKDVVVHIQNGILLNHKKEGNWVTCHDLDEPSVHHKEWGKSQREKQISHIDTYNWTLESGTDKSAEWTGRAALIWTNSQV